MFMSTNTLIIIPVRIASTRLPRKALLDIAGKTMIQRVYEQAIKSRVGEVLIACDGNEIANELQQIGAKFVITNPDLPSGTDRIYAAYKTLQIKADFIINLQGDLPNIDPESIRICAEKLIESNCDISTLASQINLPEEIQNPNIVKIALTEAGRALYFSRSAIPYSKNSTGNYFHHIGIYGYKIAALEKFVNLAPSSLERRESLEQLRALENGLTISVGIVEQQPISVDSYEDWQKAIRFFKPQ